MQGLFSWGRRSLTSRHRYEFLSLALEYLRANDVKGAYAEFGVWTGNFFWTVVKLSKNYKSRTSGNRILEKYYALDSFSGFPKNSEGFDLLNEGNRAASSDRFLATANGFVSYTMSDVVVVPGFYSESLKNLVIPKINFAYIDCDLYESTRDVLRLLKGNNIQDGAIIAFDDYRLFQNRNDKGQQKAIKDEGLDRQLNFFSTIGWHGVAFTYQGEQL